ncbi:hypothetical protein D9613_002534 [Agrocybe pediades]|uniref:Uncharacterized protein n=1 Tax=Agrocybe pediades TaxID=84607 RepID=A0A8H4VKW2_9AGAR|nr:hypothetical protein D9613_002534 [Agrocybe pediades]
MTTPTNNNKPSFATFASQYISRQAAAATSAGSPTSPSRSGAAASTSTLSGGQPMFFSFTTDEGDESGSFGYAERGRGNGNGNGGRSAFGGRSGFGFGAFGAFGMGRGAEEDTGGGRRGGKGKGRKDVDLDDEDDPHLMLGLDDDEDLNEGIDLEEKHAQEKPKAPIHEQDDEDPYLRLDEAEEDDSSLPLHQQRQQQQRIPLLPPQPPRAASPSASTSSQPGWLAHLTRSPSPLPPQSETDTETEEEEPGRMFVASPSSAQGQSGKGKAAQQQQQRAAVPPPPRTQHATTPARGQQQQHQQQQQHLSLSMSLTDSLLPRDGHSRALDMFSLPDPLHLQSNSSSTSRRRQRRRLKHNDPLPLTIYLSLLLVLLLALFLLLVLTHRPANFPPALLPYAIVLRTIPVLVGTALTTAALSYVHVWLLSVFVRPVMIATEVGVPLGLFGCAIWAFVGSFGGAEGAGWGETTGLRIFSLFPLVLSLLLFRRLLHTLPRKIHTTSAMLTMSTRLLMHHTPLLLALSPALLLGMLLISVPFVALGVRFLLVGYTTKAGGADGGRLEWHVKAWADWGIAFVLAMWVWTWAVARGVLRTTTAGVVGEWYFGDPTLPPPPPLSTHTIHAALFRSTQPSLGSVVLAGLILTLMRLVFLFLALIHRLPGLLLRIAAWAGEGAVSSILPFPASSTTGTAARMGVGAASRFARMGATRLSATGLGVSFATWVVRKVVPGVRDLEGWVRGKVGRVSEYALVYVGLTGVGFWEAAKRGSVLVGGVGNGVGGQVQQQQQVQERMQGQGQGQGQGRGGKSARGGRGRGQAQGGRQTRNQRSQQQNQQAEQQEPLVPGRAFSASEPALSLLTLSPLTMTLPSALLSYLFVAHTLGAPHEALGVALLAGGTTLLVGAFCTGLVGDVADTLFLCYCIDKAGTGLPPVATTSAAAFGNNRGDAETMGRMRREEVRAVFEYGYVPPVASGRGGLGDEEEGSALFDARALMRRGQGTAAPPGGGRNTSNKLPNKPETIVPLRSPLPLGGADSPPPASSHHRQVNNGGSGSGGNVPFGLGSAASRMGIPVPNRRQGGVARAYTIGSDEEESGDDDGLIGMGAGETPTQGQYVRQQQQQQPTQQQGRAHNRTQADEDDLDPFGSSSVVGDDDEVVAKTPIAAASVGGSGHRHGFAAFLQPQQGHLGQAQAVQGRQKMMTSTQELNVKSRFLMDMNASAASTASSASQASEGVSEASQEEGEEVGGFEPASMLGSQFGPGSVGASASGGAAPHGHEHGHGHDEQASDGEGSELGPGSDFFK